MPQACDLVVFFPHTLNVSKCPRPLWQSFAASGGYDRHVVTNDTVVTNNSGDAFVPVNRWDAGQLIAFGLAKPAAPILDPNGRGNSLWAWRARSPAREAETDGRSVVITGWPIPRTRIA